MRHLCAGFARGDITPPLGVTMDGFQERTKPSTGTHDKLSSRVLFLEDGENALFLISCDVCWFTSQHIEEVGRRLVKSKTDHVMMLATHTHSGPAMTDLVAAPNVEGLKYLEHLPSFICETAESAARNAEAVRITLTRHPAFLSINRRKPHGSVDPEIISMVLRNRSDRPLGALVNYACHPTVLGEDNLKISADFPGYFTSSVEQNFGGDFVCLFLNGASGDLNPYTCTGYRCTGSFSDAASIGGALASQAMSSGNVLDVETESGIAFQSRIVGPLEPYGMSFNINAASIGDAVILGMPGEIFCSTGLAVKEHHYNANLIVASYCNGYCGYFPTTDAFTRGDYETKSLCWIDQTGEEQIRNAGIRLCSEILGDEGNA